MSFKVNFGCGENRLEGWRNYDSDLDVTQPLPFGDSTIDECMAEHLAEHLTTPDFFRFVMECKRVLKDGGKLWLSLPVLDRLSVIHARDIILGHLHLAAYTEESLGKILSLCRFSERTILKDRPEIFGHWKIIGEEKDNLESCRILMIK